MKKEKMKMLRVAIAVAVELAVARLAALGEKVEKVLKI